VAAGARNMVAIFIVVDLESAVAAGPMTTSRSMC
jgi:hypothetical protein